MIDFPPLGRRCRLPRGALSRLVQLQRNGAPSAMFWLLDGLAPSEHARGFFVARSGGTIPETAGKLLSLFGPAKNEFSALTMAPDLSDQSAFPAELVAKRYHELIHSFPAWKNADFQSLPRNSWYRELVQAEEGSSSSPSKTGAHESSLNFRDNRNSPLPHFFLIQEDETPYGNLALHLNLQSSDALRALPSFFPAELFDILSWAGHSERVAIIPSTSPLLSENKSATTNCAPRFGLPAGISIDDTITALSYLWIPDLHEQSAWDSLQKPFGIWSNDVDLYGLQESAKMHETWTKHEIVESLSSERFETAFRNHRTVAVIVAEPSHNGAFREDSHLMMINGVSGANGGF